MGVYGLVDCNNFYVSCERVFNPALENQPVAILSNNDGCIIARSNEVRQLGIPMGAPYFKYRDICEQNQVQLYSSNYALYGDLSQRIMSSLRQFCARLEIYSIDEAFLYFDDDQDLSEIGATIRKKIKMWIGIPVSIGFGRTKTLAKAANRFAKLRDDGVFSLVDPALQDIYLSRLSVDKIWGVGHQLSKKLLKLGIETTQQLRQCPPARIRQLFGVVLERTVLELNNVSCIPIKTFKPKKSIISSRSFGEPIQNLPKLEEAISYYTAIACEKLRKQHSKAQGVYVFLQNNQGILARLATPSADTSEITQIAKAYLKKIYMPHVRYKKAGVMLVDIRPDSYQQYDLFIQEQRQPIKKSKQMQVMDHINDQLGKQAIFFAAQGIERSWQTRSEKKTAHFTTCWDELMTINANS